MSENKTCDALFDELVLAPKTPAAVTAILAGAAAEFSGGTEEQKSRATERAEIETRISHLTRELRKHRNVKNVRRAHANRKLADKRKTFKDEITSLKLRLVDIQVEIENEA